MYDAILLLHPCAFMEHAGTILGLFYIVCNKHKLQGTYLELRLKSVFLSFLPPLKTAFSDYNECLSSADIRDTDAKSAEL